MKKKVESILDVDLINHLQNRNLFIISTIDYEEFTPTNRALSWVYALNESKIRFVVDAKSKLIANILKTNKVNLIGFLKESVISITGECSVLKDHVEGIPFKVSMLEININKVEDIMFYGSKLVKYPEYEKINNEEKQKELDNLIFKAMMDV
jgi:hypothetical protein